MNGSGVVAVAMTASSSVEELASASGSFSTIDLPSDSDQPLGLAYSGVGELAVGMSNLAVGGEADDLALIGTGGSLTSETLGVPGESWEVTPYGSSQFMVGSISPQVVSADGSVSSVIVPPGLVGSESAPTPILPLGDGSLIGIASSGLIEFPRDASSVEEAEQSSTIVATPSVPTTGCSTPSQILTGSSPPTTAPPSSCKESTFQIVTVDGLDNVWVVPPTAPESVAMLAIG